MLAEHGLRVHLLGGLEIEGVPALSVGSRKARAILRRLAAARGRAVPVDELVEVAWPEGPPVRAAEQLPVLTSRLRAVVGAERLPRGDLGYSLHCDWLDIVEVETATTASAAALASGHAVAAHALGRAGLELVRGPLLPEDQDALWLDAQRSALERTVSRLRLVTAEAALAGGSAREAVELAQRCRDDDPFDEVALRLLLRALASSGRTAAALTTYLTAVERLRDELGTDPAPETEQTYLALLRTAGPAHPDPVDTTSLPGRENELQTLLHQLRELPALVVVEGPPGIGKTSLLEHLANRAQADGAAVVRAVGDREGGALPLQPVLDALALALRPMPPADRVTVLGPDADLLGSLLHVTATPATASYTTLTSGGGRPMLMTALEGALVRLGSDAPVLLLVDDAHHVDEATAQLLHHCTRPAGPARLLVVVACRPNEGPTWRGARELSLGPLDRAAVSELVGEQRAQELWARSGGHPLFLTELARYGGSELPDSVLTAVAQRCAGTGEVAQTLRIAAILGDEVDVDLLAALLEQPVGAVLDHLDAAVQQRLLRTTAQGYAFAHDLYREALASLVSPARAAVLHRDAARLLARRTGVDPGRLGHHALAGGDDALAAAALAAAAEVAAARYEHDQALALLDRAVTLSPTPARRLQRARALLLTGRYDDADAEAQSAWTEGAAGAVLELRALAAYLRRDIDDALALAQQAATTATDPELAAGCLALAGRILLGRGELAKAEEALREAMSLAIGPMRALGAVWLSIVLSAQGDAVQAYAVVTSPDTGAARTQPLVEPHRCLALGRSLALLGRGAEALAVFDQLAVTVEQQHVRRFAGRAENYRGWVLRNLGATAEADFATQAAWDAVQSLDEVSAAEARGHAILDLADACLRSGDLAAASDWLDRATRAELAPHVMKWRFDLRRDLSLGRLALATGDVDHALGHAADVHTRADAIGVARFTVQADILTARARHREGGSLELDRVAATAAALTEVAPLESWWLLADLARDLNEPRFARWAAARVDALLPGAGPWADALRTAARHSLAGLPV